MAPAAKAAAKSAASHRKSSADKGAPAKAKGKAAPSVAVAKVEDVEGKELLGKVLDNICKCCDHDDQDGEIGRVEFFATCEAALRIVTKDPKEDLTIKQRKAIAAWWKEQDVLGSGNDTRMAFDTFKSAIVPKVEEYLQITEDAPKLTASQEPKEFATWMQDTCVSDLEQVLFPEVVKKVAAAAAEADLAQVETAPEYPLTIGFKELPQAIAVAKKFGKRSLVLASGKDQVETYFSYQMTSAIDLKQVLGEVLLKKCKTKDQALDDMSKSVKMSLDSSGFCKPLWIRMANTAFALTEYLHPTKFPEELFSADESVWNPAVALEKELINKQQHDNLVIDMKTVRKKWDEFNVVITHTGDLAFANEYLKSALPKFDQLAILVVDPASCS